jgi:hypothetical protein
MSAAVRFLAVAVAGWVLVRGMALGLMPGAEAFSIAEAEAAPAPSPIVATEFPPIEPVQSVPSGYPPYPAYAPYPAVPAGYAPYPIAPPRYAAIPVYYPAPASVPVAYRPAPNPPSLTEILPEPEPRFYAQIPPLDEWPLSRIASSAGGEAPASVPAGIPPALAPGKLDRLQLSAWAHLRGNPVSTGALASGGMLGGSRAGARLTYKFDRRIAVSLRSTSPVGGSRGGEVAAGVRLTPFPAIPVSLTAERRQAVGSFSTGRNDFALFLDGGVYQRPLGWNLMLDAYAQAGIVGHRSRDLFADGGFTVMRPLHGRFSIGGGAWGGYQPGLYRIDVGPRVSMRVRPNIRIDFDYRQRLAGAAEPRSGPAVTLAADF